MINDTMVTLQGHVGGTVALQRAGDTPVARLRVACTPRRLKRATGEWIDGETQWYSVSAWRNLGEHCARSLASGDPVILHGRLQTRTYVNKDGVEVTAMEVEALLIGHDLSRGITTFRKRPSPAELEAMARNQAEPGDARTGPETGSESAPGTGSHDAPAGGAAA